MNCDLFYLFSYLNLNFELLFLYNINVKPFTAKFIRKK